MHVCSHIDFTDFEEGQYNTLMPKRQMKSKDTILVPCCLFPKFVFMCGFLARKTWGKQDRCFASQDAEKKTNLMRFFHFFWRFLATAKGVWLNRSYCFQSRKLYTVQHRLKFRFAKLSTTFSSLFCACVDKWWVVEVIIQRHFWLSLKMTFAVTFASQTSSKWLRPATILVMEKIDLLLRQDRSKVRCTRWMPSLNDNGIS